MAVQYYFMKLSGNEAIWMNGSKIKRHTTICTLGESSCDV